MEQDAKIKSLPRGPEAEEGTEAPGHTGWAPGFPEVTGTGMDRGT